MVRLTDENMASTLTRGDELVRRAAAPYVFSASMIAVLLVALWRDVMRRLTLLVVLIVTTSVFAFAQSDAPAYQKPPQAIVDIMDAAPLPGVAVSPLRDVIALVPRRSMPSIAELARPWLGLAGVADRSGEQRPARTLRPALGITLRTIGTGAERTHPGSCRRSHRAGRLLARRKRLAFTDTRDTRIDLHIADVATGATRVVDAALNTIVGGCGWLIGQLRAAVPVRRRPIAGRRQRHRAAPSGPNIQENRGTWRADSARSRIC